MDEPAEVWEQRYAERGRVWSGHANQALVDIAVALAPGRALDLGCGEGGDVVWLAQRGWDATGIDISPSAIARARSAVASHQLTGGRATFEVGDLEQWVGGGETYDLVSAFFLHSSAALSREQILRRATERVAPGGHFLVVAHAAPPPWSQLAHRHSAGMPQPGDDLAALNLSALHWDVELVEVRQREAVGPEGQPAVLDDGIVLARRR